MKHTFFRTVRVAALPLFIVTAMALPMRAAHAVPTNLIQNGSFETGDFTDFTVTNGNAVGVAQGFASDGNDYAVFNAGESTPSAVISQDITTVVGQSYTVAFDYGITGALGATQSVIVGFTGSADQKATASSPNANGPLVYTPFSFTFTATSTTSTVSFSDDPTNNGVSTDGNLDNIRVTQTNNAPTAVNLSNNKVKEGLPSGTFVGAFSTVDADSGETYTYTLPAGVGDNSSFSVSGNNLRTAEVFNAATKSSYDITVRSTDSGGSFFDQELTITVLESTKPTVTISTPTVNAKINTNTFGPGSISGTANDNVAVTSVQVRLSRKRNNVNEYYNGTAFVTTQSTVAADVTGNTWSLSNVPSAGQLDSGLYSVQVYALDAANNKSDYANTTFTLNSDFVAPTVAISAPAANAKVLISDFVNGAANGTDDDDVAVTAVKVRLSRKQGNANVYYNGSNFVSTNSVVDADLNGATWKLLSNAPSADKLTPGAYTLAVYAVDAAGNKSTTVSTSFTLGTDFVAPSVAIATPTQNQIVNINAFGPGTISGVASDDQAVTSVKLKLQRKRGAVTEYYNGTAFTTTVATFDATLNGGNWSYDTAIPASVLDRGAYTLYATASDAAGNTKTSASRVFNVTGTATPPTAPAALSKSAGNS